MAFQDLPDNLEEVSLEEEPSLRSDEPAPIYRRHPSQLAPDFAEAVPGDIPDRKSLTCLASYRTALREPIGAKILLGKPFFMHRMIDHSRGDITNVLARGHQPFTEFGVFSADETVPFAAQIGAEPAVFFKRTFSESDVGAEWSPSHFSLQIAVVEFLSDKRHAMAKYRRQSLFLLVPLVVPAVALHRALRTD